MKKAFQYIYIYIYITDSVMMMMMKGLDYNGDEKKC